MIANVIFEMHTNNADFYRRDTINLGMTERKRQTLRNNPDKTSGIRLQFQFTLRHKHKTEKHCGWRDSLTVTVTVAGGVIVHIKREPNEY